MYVCVGTGAVEAEWAMRALRALRALHMYLSLSIIVSPAGKYSIIACVG